MLVNFGFLLIEIIFIYACLSTRPEIWCEVAGIAYSPVSATFGIIPAHLEMRDVRCLVSPSVRSAAVTWITHCCLLNLLTFDEFERVMRAVKNVLSIQLWMLLIHRDRHGSKVLCVCFLLKKFPQKYYLMHFFLQIVLSA